MNRFVGFAAIALVTASPGCDSGEDGAEGAPRKDAYDVAVLTTQPELGQVLAFNARGQIACRAGGHGLAIVDIATRVFTTIGTDQTRFLGMDDDGDVLFQNNGPYQLRHGDGRVEELPVRIEGNGEFTPFSLAQGGAVWGFAYEQHEGVAATPGYAMLKDGVVSQFHGWGDHPPPSRKPYGPYGASAAGQVLFCSVQDGTEISGNGLPKTECFIAQPDGSATYLNPIYVGAFRATPLRINARGEVAGTLDYGQAGLGGQRAFLYEAPVGYLLGEVPATAVHLNDAGDVVYALIEKRITVLVRKANGDKHDITDYLRHPDPLFADANVSYQSVLALNTKGQMLVVQPVRGSTVSNVSVLTPR